MKKITLIVSAFLFSLQAFSQSPNWQWAKGMGGIDGDAANSIALDASGSVYTTGSFTGTVDFDPGAGTFNLSAVGSQDIFICKLDASGNFVWAKAMGGVSGDGAKSIALDASGNIYTTGGFSGTADFDPGAAIFNLTGGGMFISKLNNSGNFVWAKRIGGTGAVVSYSIALDAFSNVYTTGYFGNTADFNPGAATFNLTSYLGFDIFISKLNSSGNFVWAKQMGGTGVQEGHSIAIDASGSVYTTGSFADTADFDPGPGTFNLISPLGWHDIFISKLDSSGNFVWAKQMVGGGDDEGNSIVNDALGNVYTTGDFVGTVDFDPGAGIFNLTGPGMFISKLDSSGNFVWAERIGGSLSGHNAWGYSIVIDTAGSGDVYTTGKFQGTADFDPDTSIGNVFNLTSNGQEDIFISKLDSSGNFVWAKAIGGTASDRGYSIALNASSNVYLAGVFWSATISFGSTTLTNASIGNYSDFFVAKLDTAIVITGTNETENFVSSFFLYPNPATTEIVVESAGFKVERIEMYSVVGEKVKVLPLNPLKGTSASIDVSDLTPGIYFVAVTDEKGNRAVRKVVKM